ncbi:unnamed protein product [Amoebophrya sp. A120]|nr:unnamed protein product [Amoebophrya sp. A120]|eukprot:GSA120T00002956001.1
MAPSLTPGGQLQSGGSSSSSSADDLWVNKYAPKTFEDAVGNEDMLSVLQQYTHEPEQMPSMILAGPPGCGKTTALHVLAHALHGEEKEENCLEINASDQRGIDVVRELIVNWLSNFRFDLIGKKNKAYRLVLLDEFDNMTVQGQEALRKVMEQYSDRARFALACNHPSKILDAIISRCSVLKFEKIDHKEIVYRIVQVCRCENLTYDAAGLDALCFMADGDMRKAITMLQAVADRVRDGDVRGSPKNIEREQHTINDVSDENRGENDVVMDDYADGNKPLDETSTKEDASKEGDAAAKESAGDAVATGEIIAVTKANVLRASDAPNPDLLKSCIRSCLFGQDWQQAFFPIVRLERAGYPLRDVMCWLQRMLLEDQSLNDLSDDLRAELVNEVADAHGKMVRYQKFSLLQIDALLTRLRLKYNLREKQGLVCGGEVRAFGS